MKHHEITINDSCIGCSLCVNDCPAHNIQMHDKKAEIIAQDCVLCGHCEAICPQNAVFISGYEQETVKKQQLSLDPNVVLESIRFRRSIRQFQEKDIPIFVMDQILEAARLTHTSKNSQDVLILILDKQKAKVEAIAVKLIRRIKPIINMFSPMARRNEISDHFFFFQAPKVLIVCANDAVNGILAASNMEFVAQAHGLGVLYSGFFLTAMKFSYKIRKILDIPHGKKPAAVLVLGYPKIKYQRSPKREPLDVKVL